MRAILEFLERGSGDRVEGQKMYGYITAWVVTGIGGFLLIVPREDPIPTGIGWNMWTFAVIVVSVCWFLVGAQLNHLSNKYF